MDLTDSTAPRSDQLNADDLMAGPRTVTIEEVRPGTSEQPVNVTLVEFPGRPFKPSKSMLRVLVAAWGKDATVYAGRRLTLYRDPAVRFGGQDVGGIRISHMSHLDKRLTVALTVTRGKRAPFTVEPLAEVKGPRNSPDNSGPTAEQIAASTDPAALRAMWQTWPTHRVQIEDRVAELNATADEGDAHFPADGAA